DRGQRGRQNRLVERPHERRQQHAKDDQQRLSMGESLALTAGSVGIHRQVCSGCELAGSGVCAVALAAGSKARPAVRPAAARDWADVRNACGASCAPHRAWSVAVRQNASVASGRTFPCRRRGRREIDGLLDVLALLARRPRLYLSTESKVPSARFVAGAHCPRRPARWRLTKSRSTTNTTWPRAAFSLPAFMPSSPCA